MHTPDTTFIKQTIPCFGKSPRISLGAGVLILPICSRRYSRAELLQIVQILVANYDVSEGPFETPPRADPSSSQGRNTVITNTDVHIPKDASPTHYY